jgi:hypothetical protein
MELTVQAGGPGELMLRSPVVTERFQEVAPGYFRARDRSMEIAFADDGRGGYSHLFLSIFPPMAAEKVELLHGTLLASSLLLFLSVLVLMPVRYVLQRNVEGLPPLRGPERGLR